MITNDSEQGQRPGSISQDDKTRKLKYWGLGLIILGILLEAFGVGILMEAFGPIGFLIGIVISGIGLALFAQAYGKPATLAFWALLPLAGPFYILIGLPLENLGKRQPQLKRRLSWGGSILCILFVAGFITYPVYFEVDNAQQMEQSSTPIIRALSKYKNDHAKFPESLDELAPQYVSEVPKCQPSSQSRIVYFYRKEQDAYELVCPTMMFNKHRYRSITKQWDDLKD